tara:strand:- start:37570 stop:38979 length:1410 start_codon:yes stop_codon:yes gene_type:complete
MKKILTLILVSVLGGIMTLSAYKLFIENDNQMAFSNTETPTTSFLPTSNTNNALFKPYETPDLTKAAENSIHSVVHVKNTAIVSGPTSVQDLIYGRSFIHKQELSSGSGVIITPDGYIVTNNHVINNSQELSVTLNNNKTYDAKIIGTDTKTDIALLKIDADEDLPFATFGDSDNVKIGEWVLAVGNPFNLTSTVTAGIISSKFRSLEGQSKQSYIQTDAAVNKGNSGGALVNTKGDLIGINTAIASETGSYIGYSFAVPSNVAKKVVNDIMEYGNVQNGILGIIPKELNGYLAEELNIDETEGIYIDNVEEGSGADKSGLKKGDIIKGIDGIKISRYSDLKGVLNAKSLNDDVQVLYTRNGNEKRTYVTLLKNKTFYFPLIGTLKNLNENARKKYRVNNGVMIENLNGSYAKSLREYGIEKGNIIISINSTKITSIEDLEQLIDKYQHESLRIELINNNRERGHYYFR